jgi:sugar (glycoside-pentoside-hexuronide) transporter
LSSVIAPPPEDLRLNPVRKSIYAAGDFTVNTVLSSLTLIYVTYFLMEVAGLRPEYAGAVQLVGRLVDAVTDPAMGRISDLCRWKAGRRRPFMLLGAIPFGFTYALLWADLPTDSQWAMFVYYTAVYVALSMSMTMLSVPYLALQPEMATSYDARTSLNTYRNVGALLGVFAAVTFRPVANALGGGPGGFELAGICFGFMIALPWVAVYLGSWERPEFQQRASSLPLREGLRLVAGHRTFRQLIGLYLLGRTAMDLAGAMMILYYAHVLQNVDAFEPMMGLLILTTLACMPLWLGFSKRSEKSRVFVIGAVWWAVCQTPLFFAQPEWPIAIILFFVPLTGIGYAAVDLMPWAMVGEVVDEDDLVTGERREGVYYGFFTFLRKLSGPIAVWLALYLLGAVGLGDEGRSITPRTLDVIRWLTAGGPMLVLFLAAWIARDYPLTRARHAEILRALEARNATRHANDSTS